jgi:hypothetical protein
MEENAKVSDEATPPSPDQPKVTQKFEENQLLGTMVTTDGIVEIRWREGKQHTVMPDVPEQPAFPKKFRKEHAKAFRTIIELIDQIKAVKTRKLPCMQGEALQLIDKQIYKDLERMNFIDSKLVQINTPNGKRQGGRVVCWITPNGKAFERQIKAAEAERDATLAAAMQAPGAPEIAPAEAPVEATTNA